MDKGVNWALEEPLSRSAFPLVCLGPFLAKLSPSEAERVGQGLGQRLEGLGLGEEDEEAQQQLEAFFGHLQVRVLGGQTGWGGGLTQHVWLERPASLQESARSVVSLWLPSGLRVCLGPFLAKLSPSEAERVGQGLGQRLEGLGEEDEEAQQQLEAFLGHLQVSVSVCLFGGGGKGQLVCVAL